MEYKKYSAFISSNYESLRSERIELINCLLDAQIIPICMEHFTATSSENFDYIKTLIDQSDVFIMLLGEVYGSCDKNGISWTENEFIYAKSIGKICYVIKTQEYQKLLKRFHENDALSDSQLNQIKLGESIDYAQIITPERTIHRIVQQIISGNDFTECCGWTRRSELFDLQWQEQNRFLDLRGEWYHVHLKDEDLSYMRVGKVTIDQIFLPQSYRILHFKATNYNVMSVNPDKKTLKLNKLQKTVWTGDYFIKEDNRIMGVYNAERFFKGTFGEWTAEKGVYRGIHIFTIVDEDNDEDTTDETIMLSGTFNDVYPSHKTGLIYLFRTKELRYNFLQEYFEETLRSKFI